MIEYYPANEIGLIIPTRHSDLAPLASSHSQFEENGIFIAISSEAIISTCTNKSKTYDFFKSHDFPTPLSFALHSDSTDISEGNLPFIAKPICGSGSSGIHIVECLDQIPALAKSGEYMGQRITVGDEYTTNCYLSRNGICICSITHKRIAVQNGESVQATTAKIPELLDLSNSIVSKLQGASGPINIQVFYQRETGKVAVIEINPRIGGGYPLADKAGGHFIEWLVQEYLDEKDLKPFSNWTD